MLLLECLILKYIYNNLLFCDYIRSKHIGKHYGKKRTRDWDMQFSTILRATTFRASEDDNDDNDDNDDDDDDDDDDNKCHSILINIRPLGSSTTDTCEDKSSTSNTNNSCFFGPIFSPSPSTHVDNNCSSSNNNCSFDSDNNSETRNSKYHHNNSDIMDDSNSFNSSIDSSDYYNFSNCDNLEISAAAASVVELCFRSIDEIYAKSSSIYSIIGSPNKYYSFRDYDIYADNDDDNVYDDNMYDDVDDDDDDDDDRETIIAGTCTSSGLQHNSNNQPNSIVV